MRSSRVLLGMVLGFIVVVLSPIWGAPPAVEDVMPAPRVAMGKGMVAASESNAARVGADVLRAGGNAVDAAVAVGFALAVTYPAAGNIGGGGFLVLRMADGRVAALDFRERAPLAAFATMYQDANNKVMPRASLDGWRAVGTPGTVAGLWAAHRRFGKLPWRRLVEPAVRLAQDGFRVTPALADSLRKDKRLGQYVESRRIFYNNGRPFRAGEVLRQHDLGGTLWDIALRGSDGFYKGDVAEAIARASGAGGGYLRLSDLSEYKAVFRAPLVGTYRKRYTIVTMPPPSSGGIALLNLLGQMETFDPKQYALDDSRTTHRRVEAMRRAFADRAFYLGDPDFVRVPVSELVAKSYAKARASTIRDGNITSSATIREGDPFPPAAIGKDESPETTHYSTADGAGNVVSVTYTLNTGFGSGVVATGTGVLMNNEMDDFAAKPGVPNGYGLIQSARNSIAPGKRPLSSMTPTIVLRDGKPHLVVGSPGGPTIINTVFQVVSNVIDYDLPLVSAVRRGRVHHQWLPDTIRAEPNALSPKVRRALEQVGHKFATSTPTNPVKEIGDVQAIARDGKAGTWIGVSDGRAPDGLAVAP